MERSRSPSLLLLLLLSLISSSMAEIKNLKITADSRPMILLEEFGFTPHGSVIIDISDATFASNLATPDPNVLGFFLLSEENLIQALYESQSQQRSEAPGCVLSSSFVRPLFTFHELSNGRYNNSFPISRPDQYSLFFANCAPETLVTMSVHTEMYNTRTDGTRDYLSVGQAPVPSLYFVFALVYIVFLAAWSHLVFFKNRLSAHRIHFLMAGLLLTKVLNLLFAAEDQHYIRSTGSPHGWDILFYLFQFLKGVLLFTVIVLIGTGWSFLKPFLQDREKKVLMILIPLQVIANIASTVIGETGPFIRDWVTWNQVFLLIDIVCCCAILFPIIWSIRSLRETSKTDGKAARNLSKLTLFRQFYIIVVGYLYFTRIVVFALKTITAYKYRWVSVAAEETASLAFYAVMFFMFRPVERNQYFVLDEDEEEAAQAALREEEFEL
ncbi:protein CANDIDATE G-PROTEIN COUPLED RECEPTOR 7-like [Dioscorea cayenensis subsp. rotundata]|uniref:Protein CANDIDATE G-PROTEIN COUPLED RECEPTOR 7-like n=1 Tax=Dioscorea cayennensis subsp. rotundata TaxID=55577 RepID=A0AB40D3F0_DIOCR|nr:protein CANDIDATE G-PROTEIN COUPLED RECEPTOR 7-like [Dioscorea cayenensis subsp. rotundata]